LKGLIALVCTLLALIASCTDPVRDERVAELPPEDPDGPGPDHRAGQACLLCHSEGGSAKTHFAVAGTVWENESTTAKGAPGLVLRFVDGLNRGPPVDPVTGPSGNFFVRAEDWDPAYPFYVGIYEPGKKDPLQRMKTSVNREGSCNFCHRKNPATEDSIGQIFAKAGQ
jgi:hypothetical protein